MLCHTPTHLSTVSSEPCGSNDLEVLLQAWGLSFKVQALRDRHLLHTDAQCTVSTRSATVHAYLTRQTLCGYQESYAPPSPTPANNRCSIVTVIMVMELPFRTNLRPSQQRHRQLLLPRDPRPPPVLPLAGRAVEVHRQGASGVPRAQRGHQARVGEVHAPAVEPSVLISRQRGEKRREGGVEGSGRGSDRKSCILLARQRGAGRG